ncbi:MAG: hypothetical protein OXC72_11445 [Roseovarius sp.]|nr:hypothetical protein [Roseovarius sp.]
MGGGMAGQGSLFTLDFPTETIRQDAGWDAGLSATLMSSDMSWQDFWQVPGCPNTCSPRQGDPAHRIHGDSDLALRNPFVFRHFARQHIEHRGATRDCMSSASGLASRPLNGIYLLHKDEGDIVEVEISNQGIVVRFDITKTDGIAISIFKTL